MNHFILILEFSKILIDVIIGRSTIKAQNLALKIPSDFFLKRILSKQ
jgi:hypothetical protein